MNTERDNWNDVTPEDATAAEMRLVHIICGEKPTWMDAGNWRLNMRACATAIRKHVELMANAKNQTPPTNHNQPLNAMTYASKPKPIEDQTAKVVDPATLCSGVLTWNRLTPNHCGWWWYRANAHSEPKIIQVYPNMDGDLIITGGGTFDWLESLFPEIEWAGPLIAPTSSPNASALACEPPTPEDTTT